MAQLIGKIRAGKQLCLLTKEMVMRRVREIKRVSTKVDRRRSVINQGGRTGRRVRRGINNVVEGMLVSP